MADKRKPILDLQWPVSIGSNGRERVVTQGSIEEVQQGVDLTFHVPAGHIESDKSFGRPELAFASDPEGAIDQTIDTKLPRVAEYDLPVVGTSFVIEVTAVADVSTDSEVTL